MLAVHMNMGQRWSPWPQFTCVPRPIVYLGRFMLGVVRALKIPTKYHHQIEIRSDCRRATGIRMRLCVHAVHTDHCNRWQIPKYWSASSPNGCHHVLIFSTNFDGPTGRPKKKHPRHTTTRIPNAQCIELLLSVRWRRVFALNDAFDFEIASMYIVHRLRPGKPFRCTLCELQAEHIRSMTQAIMKMNSTPDERNERIQRREYAHTLTTHTRWLSSHSSDGGGKSVVTKQLCAAVAIAIHQFKIE